MADDRSMQTGEIVNEAGVLRFANGLIPKTIFMTSGSAEGGSSLNAFDNALLNAGIGDLNLVRVSSIAPPEVELIEQYIIKPGAITPVVYTSMISHQAGERITCAVAVGQAEDGGPGLIMEYSGTGDAQLAETMVRNMVTEGFFSRGREQRSVRVVTAEHVVRQLGAVVAACVFGF